ncbi:MAG: peptidoglycan D,D-transpeptidase FtsI family protein [Planctomycetota bacterium]
MQTKRRALAVFGVFALSGLILLARLAQVQLLWYEESRGEYRTNSSDDAILDTARGSIHSADGRILARDVPSFDLAVHYDSLGNSEWVGSVAELTGKSREKLRDRADTIRKRVRRIWERINENTGRADLRILEQNQYHTLISDVDIEVALMVRANPDRFEGIKIKEGRRREYPEDIAPHIVGRLSRITAKQWDSFMEEDTAYLPDMPVSRIGRRYRMEDSAGVSGLEKEYEEQLRGERGYVTHRLVFRPLQVERKARTSDPEPGRDLYLTVRADFQEAAERALHEAAEDDENDFQSGALLLLDVRTAGILAAATYPSYTRKTYRHDFGKLRSKERSPLLFRPVQSALPPGSVFKLISAIAGLSEGTVTAGTTFNCEGRTRFSGRWFHCTGYHGRTDLVEAIQYSCNVYFFQLASRLSADKLLKWAYKFGLGHPTDVDFPFERTGQVVTPRSLFGRLNLGIGQGSLLCTPLQVGRAMVAIANEGKLLTPHFVSHIADRSGDTLRAIEPDEETIPVSSEVLDAVRRGMHKAVSERGGTAREAGLERFDAAGKTGTAEMGSGQPNNAWFAGFAPYENPRIAFVVVSERTAGHGGSHAAPILADCLDGIWDEVRSLDEAGERDM